MNIEQLFLQARKAKEVEDYIEAERVYSKLAELVPNNWEAQFFSIFYKCVRTDVSKLPEAHLQLYKVVFEIIRTNTLTAEERMLAYAEIAAQIIEYITISYEKLTDFVKNDPSIGPQSPIVITNNLGLAHLRELSADLVKDDAPISVVMHAYNLAKKAAVASGDMDLVESIEKKINDLTPSQTPSRSNKCYIATAVYGSYDCPQVWTLRRFRDYTLAETWYGRLFIHVYYATSPTLVKCFGQTKWFRALWRGKLDRLVLKLNADDVSDKPYKDRIW